MKIVSVVGARPQFVKLAPFCRAIERIQKKDRRTCTHFIVHTGQHYDDDMSGVFFSELAIPKPDIDLGVGSSSHGVQTGRLLQELETVFQAQMPDVVVVFGDTNSTVAGALAAAKLNIPIAHVEAGLRSRDRRMPEEINRIVSDHVATINFAPTEQAMKNLQVENLAERSVLTGDIMLDAIRQHSTMASNRNYYQKYGLTAKKYVVATIHRAENTTPEILSGLLDGIAVVAEHDDVILPLHPRTAKVVEGLDKVPSHPRLHIVEPIGYLDMINLLANAKLAVTDSGGLQREAYFLNIPCVTIRETTEWPETLVSGANVVVGTEPESLVAAVNEWDVYLQKNTPEFVESVEQQFGDGAAADKILSAIQSKYSTSST